MDAEVQALLNEAREIDINDQDVATVLLVSVQDELHDARSRLASFESQQGGGAALPTSSHAQDSHAANSNSNDAHVPAGGAASTSTSFPALPLPPTPLDVSAACMAGTAVSEHGTMSPRLSRQNSQIPAVQLLLTVEASDAQLPTSRAVKR